MTPTPKEKAQELINKFYKRLRTTGCSCPMYEAKQCALIAVELYLEHEFWMDEDYANSIGEPPEQTHEYWQKVKTEIQNK